jgi:hypothetical protein
MDAARRAWSRSEGALQHGSGVFSTFVTAFSRDLGAPKPKRPHYLQHNFFARWMLVG